MNCSRRAGWLVPFINRQTWTAVWAAALREPSVTAGRGRGRGEIKGERWEGAGLRPALTEERSEGGARAKGAGLAY